MPRAYRHLNLSFAGGEMAPEMFGRLDDVRWQSGAARLQNFLSTPRGPARKRPGLQFIREVKQNWWNVGSVNTTTDELTITIDHDIETGDPVTVSAAGGVPAPLSDGTTYYAIKVSTTVIQVAATRDEALAGTQIDLTTIGTTVWVFSRNKAKVRLLPFRFGTDQTLVIEMGRTIVDSRSIGYFRFHTDGATLFYSTPPNYVDPQTVSAIDTATERWTCGAHDFQTGDPVVFTLRDTFDAGQETVTLDATNDVVNHTGHGFTEGDQVVFNVSGGSLPVPVVPGQVYYVKNPTANTYEISASRFGNRILFATLGSGTQKAVAMPSVDEGFLEVARTYYAIRISGTEFQVARTMADALLGTAIDMTGIGTADRTDIRIHYAYEPGDLAFDSGLPGVFYCIRRPWDTHLDHPVTDTGYWYRQPGSPDVFEVPHYYEQADLFEVTAFQSRDIVTLVHRNRPIAELRRLGATQWVLEEVRFNESIDVPQSVAVTPTAGQGVRITANTAADPSVITTTTDHLLAIGTAVVIEGLNLNGNGIQNGHYVVNTVPTTLTFTLKQWESGNTVASANANTLGANPRVRQSSFARDWDETYVVTALDESGEESAASARIAASNNLLVPGAYNTITWDPVEGADRYHVYKEQEGLMGFIGEVDADQATTFVDDNIAPDQSITPPILDRSLYRSAEVTFDSADDLVMWEGHGLEEGASVVFRTDGTMPGGVDLERIYYVLDPGPDAFRIAATAGGSLVDITSTGSGTHTGRGGHFPGGGTYFQQRRCFCGSHLRPHDVWMTASGTESDLSYSIPVVDDDRIHIGMEARESELLRHMVPLGHLLVLGSAAEHRVTPVNSDALTPSSVAARSTSHIGAATVAPVLVNNTVLFVADRGGHLREMGLQDVVRDYVTGDLSLRATHLFDSLDVVQLGYSRAPIPVVWAVSTSGRLLGFTYAPQEAVGGWHRHVTAGNFESVAAVAEGDEDHAYVVVERTILGTPVRYVERMADQQLIDLEDAFHVDSGLTYDGVPATTITGLDHLEGESVTVLADGVVQGPFTVTGGQITLTTAASKVHVGLSYSAQLRTLPLGMQVDAALGSGRTKNVNQVWLRTIDSGAFQMGRSGSDLVDSPQPPSGQLLTEVVPVTVLGAWDLEGQVLVQQDAPLPLTVAALTMDVATGG